MIRSVTWSEVRERLAALDLREGEKVYGIPRNGMVLCSLLPKAVEVVTDPAEATVFLDDLVDSGATRERYRKAYPGVPFEALFVKEPGDPWIRFPWENENGPEDAVIRLLTLIGEDANREGLRDTPARVVKMLGQLTEGYGQNAEEILSTSFESASDELVVVRDIPFSSLCEHHMLPFHGTATIGYVPHGRVFGLSKLPRLVHCYARRLQLQEQLTSQIADAIFRSALKPLGVGVVIRAHHTCMSMRGVRSPGEMVTSATYGIIRTSAREEFMRLAGL